MENTDFTLPKGKKAIFVGRFQPFHNGHLEAIKWITKQTNEVNIVIGSMQEFGIVNNPLNFKKRREIIEKALANNGIKNYKIFGLPDFRNDIAWSSKLCEIVQVQPSQAVLVSLNDWVKDCAKKISIEIADHPVFCDNLSATQVRAAIRAGSSWENLVPQSVAQSLKNGSALQKIMDARILPEDKIVEFIKKQMEIAGLQKVVMGVSGGIDSAVMAVILHRAFKKKALFFWMPFFRKCPFGKNVLRLEKAFKMPVTKLYLDKVIDSYAKALPDGGNLVYGNLKPRIRMNTLYYFANLKKALVIGTTNRTELEIGYFTKYGDGGVDLEPIADMYKDEIYDMARRLDIPSEIMEVAPTAALWPGQTDEKELGLTYFQLNTILKLLSQGFTAENICQLTNTDPKKMQKILDRKVKNAHKLAMPPICKIK